MYGQPYLYKGDIDNLAKFVLDSCNALLFDDDCTVYSLTNGIKEGHMTLFNHKGDISNEAFLLSETINTYSARPITPICHHKA
jgi:hypothetical protein